MLDLLDLSPRAFDDIFDLVSFPSMSSKAFREPMHNVMPTNVVESEKNITFEVQLVGVDKKDIMIDVVNDGKVLKISVSNETEQTNDDKKYLIKEIKNYNASRSFKLPSYSNIDDISASFENGMLTIVVPKMDKPKDATKTIEIK